MLVDMAEKEYDIQSENSDRGLKYCSNEYQIMIMTEKYDPYENAIDIYNNKRPHLPNQILTPVKKMKRKRIQIKKAE
jgi:hypothetical protein